MCNVRRAMNARNLAKKGAARSEFLLSLLNFFCFLRRCGVAKSVTTQSNLDMRQFILFEKPEKTNDLMENALPKRRPKKPIERLTLLTENLCAAKEGRLPWLSGVLRKFSRVLISAISKIQSSVYTNPKGTKKDAVFMG